MKVENNQALRRARRIEIIKKKRARVNDAADKKRSSSSSEGLPFAASKAEERRQKNRLSAEFSRLRRVREADDLRAKVDALERENLALKCRLSRFEPQTSSRQCPSFFVTAESNLSRFTGFFEPAVF